MMTTAISCQRCHLCTYAKNSNGPSKLPCGTQLATSIGLEEEFPVYYVHVECVIIKNQKSSSKHFLEFDSVVILLAIDGIKLYQNPY